VTKRSNQDWWPKKGRRDGSPEEEKGGRVYYSEPGKKKRRKGGGGGGENCRKKKKLEHLLLARKQERSEGNLRAQESVAAAHRTGKRYLVSTNLGNGKRKSSIFPPPGKRERGDLNYSRAEEGEK